MKSLNWTDCIGAHANGSETIQQTARSAGDEESMAVAVSAFLRIGFTRRAAKPRPSDAKRRRTAAACAQRRGQETVCADAANAEKSGKTRHGNGPYRPTSDITIGSGPPQSQKPGACRLFQRSSWFFRFSIDPALPDASAALTSAMTCAVEIG